MKDFTKKSKLTKTIPTRLIPVWETENTIKQLLVNDEFTESKYPEIKKIIDDLHRYFIEYITNNYKFNVEQLEKYSVLYYSRDKSKEDRNNFDTLIKELKKDFISFITDKQRFFELYDQNTKLEFGSLFKKELITEILPAFKTDADSQKLFQLFKNRTTYFSTLNTNRANIYSDKPAVSLSSRLLNENLPKFLDNLRSYNLIQKNYTDIDFESIIVNINSNLDGKIDIKNLNTIAGFNTTLSQSGIDNYNRIINGFVTEVGNKIKGVNEHLSEYRQKNNLKAYQVPLFKKLHKQILSEATSIFIGEINNDSELLKLLEMFNEENQNFSDKNVSIFDATQALFNKITEQNISLIYIKSSSISDMSQNIFHDWSLISNALKHFYISSNPTKKVTSKYLKEMDAWLKRPYISVSDLQKVINIYLDSNNELNFERGALINYLAKISFEKHIDIIKKSYEKILEIEKKNLKQDKTFVELVKLYLDSIKYIQNTIRPFHILDIEHEKDESFYSEFELIYEHIDKSTKVYNKVRNYISSKPYSKNYIHMNFNRSMLMGGWDKNKESDYGNVFFLKDEKIYLGIIDTKFRKIFKNITEVKDGADCFEKMVYKLVPTPFKMLPSVFFKRAGQKKYKPSQKVVKIYQSKSYLFNLNDLHDLIDYYKDGISKHKDWNVFNFTFKQTSEYKSLSEFYSDVEKQNYNLAYVKVSTEYLQELVRDSKLYLFQLHCKDFSKYKKGKLKLNTMYLNACFSKENIESWTYKIGGEGKILCRKASINLSAEKLKEGYHAKELKDKFDYPIIKDKRFTEDQYFLNFAVKINTNAEKTDINTDVLKYLHSSKDKKHIIGIDRGERNLLYVTVINENGEIIESRSLNVLPKVHGNKTINIDYQKKLDKREKERNESRQNWSQIGNIKDLKKGYISQAVSIISKLVIEYNAIVILEDLSSSFKNTRKQFEKEIYQQFENALMNKLNYLVFKDKSNFEPGGLYNAYQLTKSTTEYKENQKQNGILFFVNPDYTSKVAPGSGFVNLLRPKYESIIKSKEFFKKFDCIKYNKNKDWFEFSFDYKSFHNKIEGTKSDWVLSTTHDTRYKWNHQNKVNEPYFVTDKLKTLFESYEVYFKDGVDLIDQILLQNSSDFFKQLIEALVVTVTLRYTSDTNEDIIISPIVIDNYNFNSTRASDNMPNNGDSNGSYHIALKGLCIVNNLKSKGYEKFNTFVENKVYLKFIQNMYAAKRQTSTVM